MRKRRESLGRNEDRLGILYSGQEVLLDIWWDAWQSLAIQYVKHSTALGLDFEDEWRLLLVDLSRNSHVSYQRPRVQQGNVSGSGDEGRGESLL